MARTASMPQEIEVWFILPAIRRELCIALIGSFGCSQKRAAELLHVTEPAVSQYLKSKRAKTVAFDENTKKTIKEAAARLYNEPSALMKEIQVICRRIKENKTLCRLHKKMAVVPENCTACLK